MDDGSMTPIRQSPCRFLPPVNAPLRQLKRRGPLKASMTPPLERAQWLARMICPHEPALRRWLGRRTLIGLDIDDIVQEAYARLAVLPDVDHIHNPRAYFFRTAFTILVNEVRRAQIVPIDAVAQLDRLEVESMAPTPDMEAEGRQELRLLAEAIAQLSPRCREVFIARKVHGLSQRETAAQLGMAESTVEKHIAAGLRHLAAFLGEDRRGLAEMTRPERLACTSLKQRPMTTRETSAEIEEAASAWAARIDRGALEPGEQAGLESWLAGDMRRLGAFARAQAMMVRLDSAQALGPPMIPRISARRRPCLPPPGGVSCR
jgi:RNA polymerase sigma-70 factor (ECF subfamily)